MIEVRDLTKRYGELIALSEVRLTVAAGELVVVLGPSGAGKSTLLRCINRLTEPDGGEVLIGGMPVSADAKRLRALRREIAMIFQDHNLVPRLSVLKNVLTGRLAFMSVWQSVLQLFPVRDVELALQCLRRVDLEKRAWSRADTLSGGQQQRVGVARALAQQPRAILADEPVASLDPNSARVVLGDLRRAARELNIAVLCNLHQVGYAREFAERIVGICAGRVVFEGRPDALDTDALSRIYPGLDPQRLDEEGEVAQTTVQSAALNALELWS
jgi:phosphonate transport system ATP-binding protein